MTVIVMLFASSMVGPVAWAGDADACIDDSERGQRLRDGGKLIAAQQNFLSCAQASCPRIIRVDCAEWLKALKAKLPTIVLRARDRAGGDLLDVSVTIDGEKVADQLEGRAIAVDPGAHVLRWTYPGATAVDQTVVVREGEKNRIVDVQFAVGEVKHGDAGSPSTTSGVSPWVWALGGVAVASGVGFGVLAGTAKARRDELQDSCAPHCDPAEVDQIRGQLIGANVLLGVGVVAAGGALWLLLDKDVGVAASSTNAALMWPEPYLSVSHDGAFAALRFSH